MRKLLLFLLIFPFLAQGQNTVTICDGDSALIYGNWQTNARLGELIPNCIKIAWN